MCSERGSICRSRSIIAFAPLTHLYTAKLYAFEAYLKKIFFQLPKCLYSFQIGDSLIKLYYSLARFDEKMFFDNVSEEPVAVYTNKVVIILNLNSFLNSLYLDVTKIRVNKIGTHQWGVECGAVHAYTGVRVLVCGRIWGTIDPDAHAGRGQPRVARQGQPGRVILARADRLAGHWVRHDGPAVLAAGGGGDGGRRRLRRRSRRKRPRCRPGAQ